MTPQTQFSFGSKTFPKTVSKYVIHFSSFLRQKSVRLDLPLKPSNAVAREEAVAYTAARLSFRDVHQLGKDVASSNLSFQAFYAGN